MKKYYEIRVMNAAEEAIVCACAKACHAFHYGHVIGHDGWKEMKVMVKLGPVSKLAFAADCRAHGFNVKF